MPASRQPCPYCLGVLNRLQAFEARTPRAVKLASMTRFATTARIPRGGR